VTNIQIIVYYEVLAGHTHMRVFSGIEGKQRGKAGNLVMTNDEFAVFRERCEGVAARGFIEFAQGMRREV
jgi:hypothetical protein